MPPFPDDRFPLPVRDSLLGAMRAAWDRLAAPGAVFTAARRLELAETARLAHAECHLPPWRRRRGPDDGAGQVAHEVGGGAHRIDRSWAASRTAEIGEPAYVEAVAVSASVVAVDVFAEALGATPEPFPVARSGLPSGRVVDELDDIGAYVGVAATSRGANVGRSLTQVPDAFALFFGIEPAFYAAGADFQDLAWDRPLTRPQVELVAARTSAINECFY